MDQDQLIDAILRADPKHIGNVYRLSQAGRTPQEIADRFGHKNTLNVVGFLYTISALKGEREPSELNADSRKQLIFVLERYIALAADPAIRSHFEGILLKAQKSQLSEAPMPAKFVSSRASSAVSVSPVQPTEAEAKPGVYVYSYPQYLSMEAVSPDGRAFYKIGASGRVANRIERQARQTEVPEDLVLVRVFYDENPFELEAKFHSILRAANMHQKTTQGGVEWFSCNLATIDAIAAALGLRDA